VANNWLQVQTPQAALKQLKATTEMLFAELERGQHIGEIAQDALEVIKWNTHWGYRADASKQPPYSEAWAAQRRKEGLPTDVVTLRYTGTMFDAMGYEVTGPFTATLKVNPEAGPEGTPRDIVALGQTTRGRYFLGLPPKSIRRMSSAVKGRLIEAMLRNVAGVRAVGSTVAFLRTKWRIAPFPNWLPRASGRR
jgi:hypothetical protein